MISLIAKSKSPTFSRMAMAVYRKLEIRFDIKPDRQLKWKKL
jgi:hypothetical protein